MIRRLAVGLVAATGLVACARLQAPEVRPPARFAVERPLVLVPGVTGTSLRDASDGTVAFGSAASFLWPHDGGYGVAPPLGLDDALEPLGLIRRVRIAWVTKPVYAPVVDALQEAGYRLGDLRSPAPPDTLYPFAYDWRDDNVESAAWLARLLEQVRRARGEERLTVDLLCQSNGAHVCRWLAKYRDLTLAQAERGVAPASRLAIGKIVLLGTSNGGALRILREMNRGRRYVPWVGRLFQPEVFFGMRSLYQDLPAGPQDLFVDSNGRGLAVDLYDAASWQRYGWSIFAPDAAGRVERRRRAAGFGTVAERVAFLSDALARARRFQALLARDGPAWGGCVSYLLANGSRSTPRRAVLERDGSGGWRTLFGGDRAVAGLAFRERLSAQGDGHATIESQRHLSPQELRRLQPVRHIEGAHFETIVERATLELVLDVLAEPLPAGR